MFCTKCGKQIDYDSPLCLECAEAAKAAGETASNTASEGAYTFAGGSEHVYTYTPVNYPKFEAAPPVESTRMAGFGKALAGTILSFVAYILWAVSTVFMIVPEVGIVLCLITIAMGIVGLVFGIQSISTFKALKNGPGGSPVATLVLGISATVFAGLALFFSAIWIIIAVALL